MAEAKLRKKQWWRHSFSLSYVLETDILLSKKCNNSKMNEKKKAWVVITRVATFSAEKNRQKHLKKCVPLARTDEHTQRSSACSVTSYHSNSASLSHFMWSRFDFIHEYVSLTIVKDFLFVYGIWVRKHRRNCIQYWFNKERNILLFNKGQFCIIRDRWQPWSLLQ